MLLCRIAHAILSSNVPAYGGYDLIRDELLEQLAMLPPDADIVVDIGGVEEDILAVESISYRGEHNAITLKPHQADLRDAFAARRNAAGLDSPDPATS